MKRNSRGFTLVEVVVVVTILGSFVGLVSLSISSVFSARAKRCATELDAYISMCRVNSMSRAGDIEMVLDVDNKGCIRGRYYENSVVKDTTVFSVSNVTAEFTVGGVTKQLSTTDTLTLSFNRSTGAFEPQDYLAGTPVYCTSITISNSKSYVITLTPSTGNHYVG